MQKMCFDYCDINFKTFIMLNIFMDNTNPPPPPPLPPLPPPPPNPPIFIILLTCSIPVVGMYSQLECKTVDPDQMASSEASWSGSTVFSKKIDAGSTGQELISCRNSDFYILPGMSLTISRGS